MQEPDPFAKIDPKVFLEIIKNLEKRWGLTLVSFLPAPAQERIFQLQYEISKLWNGQGEDAMREVRPYVVFHEAGNLHCTHLTLARSTPKGPIKRAAFVREGHHLSELFTQIHRITSEIECINVVLSGMRISSGDLGIVLLGKCSENISANYRRRLLAELNRTLPGSFDVGFRSWDSDSSSFHILHCALGYLKRPRAEQQKVLLKHIENIRFAPINVCLDSISVIHHRYRSLAYPQEGEVRFPLGQKVEMSSTEFVNSLNLA
ncbi:MAG: hypothetical protein SWQ30_15925 [Thermodesulfobacteriota bacterium]|nr:hypothetical protein [Thermodesulfobacteriota bacterium]